MQPGTAVDAHLDLLPGLDCFTQLGLSPSSVHGLELHITRNGREFGLGLLDRQPVQRQAQLHAHLDDIVIGQSVVPRQLLPSVQWFEILLGQAGHRVLGPDGVAPIDNGRGLRGRGHRQQQTGQA